MPKKQRSISETAKARGRRLVLQSQSRLERSKPRGQGPSEAKMTDEDKLVDIFGIGGGRESQSAERGLRALNTPATRKALNAVSSGGKLTLRSATKRIKVGK